MNEQLTGERKNLNRCFNMRSWILHQLLLLPALAGMIWSTPIRRTPSLADLDKTPTYLDLSKELSGDYTCVFCWYMARPQFYNSF